MKQGFATLAPERNKTDESLRLERADQAVAARHEKAVRHADAIVDRARGNADAVLSVARGNADAELGVARDMADRSRDPDAGRAERATLREARGIADDALRDERDTADAMLSEERKRQARAMHDFLLQDENGRNTLAETRRIGRYVARMNRLIGDLVDIASIDAGKLAVAPSPGDFASLLREAVDSFQANAAARGVILESRCDAPLSAAFDHERMLQILGNLISNALKFTPRGGKVTLCGERDGSVVRISVADTGSGIPEDALESIFERFPGGGERSRRPGPWPVHSPVPRPSSWRQDPRG